MVVVLLFVTVELCPYSKEAKQAKAKTKKSFFMKMLLKKYAQLFYTH
jgi:hypothetical protein